MKILLVNSNPVVSRLTALSARKESVKLDEIKNISELTKNDYDIVFVDFESYIEELSNVLNKSNIQKRVLFYTQDDKSKPDVFNLSILKPFLPSEVSAVLRETKIEMEQKVQEHKEEQLELDELIAEKKDDLKPINVEDDIVKIKEPKIDTKAEEKKEKEVIDFEQIDLIKEEFENDKNSKEKLLDKSSDLNIIEEVSVEDIKNDIKLFEVDFKDDKKNDHNKDELLDFDIDSKNEIDLNNNIKAESTKILDEDEISNIKSLLNNDEHIDGNLSLEDIMTTTTQISDTKEEKKSKKKKREKKQKESVKESGSKVIIDSLGSLPVDDLRRLLLGSEVHITIKFPKE